MQMDAQQQYAQQQAAAAAQGAEGMQHLTEQHLDQAQGGAPPQAYTAQPVDGGAAVGGYDGNAQQGQQIEYGAPIEQQQAQQVQGDAGMAVEEGGAAA